MPRFRFTVRKTEISHEAVEIDAHSIEEAGRKAGRYAAELTGSRRGMTVVQTYDDDKNATIDRDVIAIKEV